MSDCKCKLSSCVACLRAENAELRLKVTRVKADLTIADAKIKSLEAEIIDKGVKIAQMETILDVYLNLGEAE